MLAGGQSTRMGSSKASLDWHGMPLLERVCGIVERGVAGGPVVIVKAVRQELPPLPDRYAILEDAAPGRGPLEGVRAGLEALVGRADAAFVSATDVALIHPRFVSTVCDELRDDAVVVPQVRGHRQPLSACYRVALHSEIGNLLDAGKTKPAMLFERVATRWLTDPEIAALAGSQALDSVENLNDPAAYEAACAVPLPLVSVEACGTLRSRIESTSIRATTLGQLARALDLELDGGIVTAVNGTQVSGDPRLCLAAGDLVGFCSADAGA